MIDSNSLQVGPDEDNLDDVSFRKKSDNMNLPRLEQKINRQAF